MLRLADGTSFSVGKTKYRYRPIRETDTSPRVIVPVKIEGIDTEAVLDTGGVYLVCTPDIARLLVLDPEQGYETQLRIGGNLPVRGSLHRLNLELLATQGQNLPMEVTAFVPDQDSSAIWNLPAFLGLQGCLEWTRFAVDPKDNVFYFGQGY